MRIGLVAVVWAVLVAVLAGSAAGQCTPQWLPGSSLSGVSGVVYASVVRDPDGAGPRPSELIVGGYIFSAGGLVNAGGIARWDGSTRSSRGATRPSSRRKP